MARSGGFHLNVAGVALMTDVPDSKEFFWTDYPKLSLVPYMRRARLSVFSESAPYLLGQPLNSIFERASGDECAINEHGG